MAVYPPNYDHESNYYENRIYNWPAPEPFISPEGKYYNDVEHYLLEKAGKRLGEGMKYITERYYDVPPLGAARGGIVFTPPKSDPTPLTINNGTKENKSMFTTGAQLANGGYRGFLKSPNGAIIWESEIVPDEFDKGYNAAHDKAVDLAKAQYDRIEKALVALGNVPVTA